MVYGHVRPSASRNSMCKALDSPQSEVVAVEPEVTMGCMCTHHTHIGNGLGLKFLASVDRIIIASFMFIIESVDSICRDSADTQYIMLIQKNFSKSPKQLTYKPL